MSNVVDFVLGFWLAQLTLSIPWFTYLVIISRRQPVPVEPVSTGQAWSANRPKQVRGHAGVATDVPRDSKPLAQHAQVCVQEERNV